MKRKTLINNILSNDEINKLNNIILTEAGSVNPQIVGQPAYKIAELAGFSVDKKTKVLVGERKKIEANDPFAHEKLSPILALYKAEDFDNAVYGFVFPGCL